MKKILLILGGFLLLSQSAQATDCLSAAIIPATPTMPYVQSLTCGAGNDINVGNATACGSTSYYGGNEALYAWTPSVDYTGVSIAYNGVSWSGIFVFAGCPTSGGTCVANITSSTASKTLNIPVNLTAGVTYYIMFDTWPTPNSPCPGTFTLNGTPDIATPPTPVQSPGIPDCIVGSTIDVTGSPATNVQWYWQSSATGTSTADLYTGPFAIFANGTYYLRAFHTVAMAWSASSSAITVTNFPTAPAPPAPTADINPSCITTGTILTVAGAPIGTEYYWQTMMDGTSSASPANVPQSVSTSGDYYVAAFETASGCWSLTSSISVVVDDFIPAAPTASPDTYYICTGVATQPINATAINSGMATAASGTVNIPIPDSNPTGVSSTLSISGIPAGATITEMAITFNMTHTFDADMDISLIGPNLMSVDLTSDNGGGGDNFINTTLSSAGVTSITTGTAPFTGIFLPEGTLSNLYSMPNGDYTLFMVDDAGGDVGVLTDWMITITYTLPATTIEWFDAASGGNSLGAGSTIESVGTTVMPNTLTSGAYEFYASSVSGACYSSSTTLVTVNVADVNVDLTPIAVTCNNGDDGTFTNDATVCGTAPFTYSIDGGAFGAIPTNLTVGDHDVVVMDDLGGLSGTYTITIGDAPAPTALVVDAFDYDMVEFSWTAGGTETQWYVEWGLAGFTPGTGTELGSSTVSSPTEIVTGLDGATDYDFYVAANCGGPTTAGTWVLVSQTTLCDPIPAQGFCETFDSSSPTQDCWTINNANGDFVAWDMDNNFFPLNGDEGAAIITDGNGGADDDWLITPLFTLTNNEIMSFNYAVNSGFEPNNFEVLLSTTGMAPADFSTVLLADATYSNTAYDNATIDLTAYSGECYIAIHVPGGLDGWILYIDEFCIDICNPNPGTDGTTDACRLDGTLDLNTVITQGETNGVWEFLPNPGVVSGSDVNLSLLPDGTYDFEYIVTTACTTDTTIATVTVHSASSAGNDGILDDYCTNWSSINLVDAMSGSIDLGGTWTNVTGEGTLTGSQWTPGLTTLAGSYDFEYVVSNGFCPNDTATVTVNLISCVGIDEMTNNHLVVYPNPVKDALTIQNLSIESALLQVFDVQGKLINAVQLNGVYGNYTLDMNNIERGIYVVRITTDNSVQEVRVVKQ